MNNTHTIEPKKTLLVRLMIISSILSGAALCVLMLRIYCDSRI